MDSFISDKGLIKRKYTQVNWQSFVLIPIISNFLLQFLKNYFEIGMAMLLSIAILLLLMVPVTNLFTTVVTYHESFLHLKKGVFRKDITINYSEINKITFTYNRFLTLWIITDTDKVKIPPPSNKLEEAKQLFKWLSSKNPNIEIEIIK